MDEKKVVILKKSKAALFFRLPLHLKPSKDALKEWNHPSHTDASKTLMPLCYGIRQ